MQQAYPRTLAGASGTVPVDRIASASAENAKAVLVALCNSDASIRARAKVLLKDIDALVAAVSATSQKQGVKRKADSVIKVCVKCQEPFYEEDNSNRACRYHSGNLDEDSSGDFWADHDEDCHGDIDTEEMRMEFPEGFVWDCCNKLGYRHGCTRGRHDATTGHRGRYGTKPGTVWTPLADESSDARTSDLEVESGLEEEEQGEDEDEDEDEEDEEQTRQ
ncbi:unnamed protein product [Discula destructiva]